MSESKVIINNVPDDVEKYVLARSVDGEFWYWGSWADRDSAYEAMKNLVLELNNCVVICVKEGEYECA